MKVKDCMNKDVLYCNPDSTVSECAKIMGENHIGCLPVCDTDNKVVGLLTDRDLILRCVACDKTAENTPVRDVMTCNVSCCSPEQTVEDAEKQMGEKQIRRIPVVENDKIVGILTLGDLARDRGVSTESVCDCLEHICCNSHGQNNAD